MDPWAEGEDDAGPSTWNAASSRSPKQSPRLSPSRVTNQSSVDPWADPSNAEEVQIGLGHASHVTDGPDLNDVQPPSFGSNADFDPWGGGAPPPISNVTLTQHSYSPTTEADNDDVEHDGDDRGWQPSTSVPLETHNPETEPTPSIHAEERSTPVYDEDDPWGSGAKARQLKSERDAEAAARQMEILEIKEGGVNEAEQSSDTAEAELTEKASDSAKEAEVRTSEPAQGMGGWRSIFSRTAPKAVDQAKSVDMARKSSEGIAKSDTSGPSKASPRPSNSTAAPRLWQAPTLRAGHAKTSSNASQGSVGKDSTSMVGAQSVRSKTDTSEVQGPGWTMAAKKQTTASSGGFLSSFLSGANKADSSDRPPVISAADADESGDMEETGIEWDAGAQFEASSTKPSGAPAKDLLSNDEPMQESGIGRLIGRWRNRQTGNESSMAQPDDLSWLENIGGPSAPPQESGRTKPDEDEWAAFTGTQTHAPKTGLNAIPKAGGRIVIPNIVKKASIASPNSPGHLLPPPRGGTPTQRVREAVVVPEPYDPDEGLDEFRDRQVRSGYRDEHESYDDALLNHGAAGQGPQPARKSNSTFLSSLSGRPVKPYTFDEDDHEEDRDDSWSAFKDTKRYADAQPPRNKASVTQKKLQPQVLSPPTRPQQPKGPGQATVTLAPPPPSSLSRSTQLDLLTAAPTSAAPEPTFVRQVPSSLSQGKTLTNDDLSFFENL